MNFDVSEHLFVFKKELITFFSVKRRKAPNLHFCSLYFIFILIGTPS